MAFGLKLSAPGVAADVAGVKVGWLLFAGTTVFLAAFSVLIMIGCILRVVDRLAPPPAT